MYQLETNLEVGIMSSTYFRQGKPDTDEGTSFYNALVHDKNKV